MVVCSRRESQAAVAQLSDAFNRRWLGRFSVRCGSCMCDFFPSAFHLFMVCCVDRGTGEVPIKCANVALSWITRINIDIVSVLHYREKC